MIKAVKKNINLEKFSILDIDNDVCCDKHFIKETIDLSSDILEFNSCVFENCKFINETNNLYFIQNKFINCDLSNVKISSSKLYINEFCNCLLTGIVFDGVILEHVKFISCNFVFSSFFDLTYRSVSYSDSNLNKSYFDNIKYKELLFNKCELCECEMRSFKLKDINLSTSNIERIKITVEDIAGVSLNRYQLIDVISLLKINIVE